MPAARTIPASYGHATAADTIGVGATPWWAPAPYLGQNPLANEPFSSSGPALYVFNPDGTPLTTGPTTVENPTITAPDGGNTSFFSPGQIIDTTNPPFPGEPATADQPRRRTCRASSAPRRPRPTPRPWRP